MNFLRLHLTAVTINNSAFNTICWLLFVISADEQNIVLGDPNSQSSTESLGDEGVDEFEKLDKSPTSTPGVDTWTTT